MFRVGVYTRVSRNLQGFTANACRSSAEVSFRKPKKPALSERRNQGDDVPGTGPEYQYNSQSNIEMRKQSDTPEGVGPEKVLQFVHVGQYSWGTRELPQIAMSKTLMATFRAMNS